MPRHAALRLFLVLLCALLSPSVSASETALKRPPLVIAHYMPWFEAKPGAKQWGWHWTMNAFDPEKLTDGKRHIAAHYYPLIGPYDSNDPAVIEYHLLTMKLTGIDGIMVDWYGLSDLFDYPILHRNTVKLFEAAAKLGLKVGICYEDQTITKLVETKRIRTSDRVVHAVREIQWLQDNWFSSPAYLKLNGKPVLLSFGYGGLSNEKWEQVLPPTKNSLIYLSEHHRRPIASGAFDWPQPQTGLMAVDKYYAKNIAETLWMPVVFPRFHDIYKEAKIGESYGNIPDAQGKTFSQTLERAWKSDAPLIQIATWNDWGEGTIIEPSREFGYRDLEAILKLRRASNPRFRATSGDLRLPYRLYLLRNRQSQDPKLTSQCNAIARLLSTSDLSRARDALKRAEAL